MIIPKYQLPVKKQIEVSQDPFPSPIFVSSDSLQIIGFKDSNNPRKEFVKVKPEFILNNKDGKMVYLGNKRYVLPIYKVIRIH